MDEMASNVEDMLCKLHNFRYHFIPQFRYVTTNPKTVCQTIGQSIFLVVEKFSEEKAISLTNLITVALRYSSGNVKLPSWIHCVTEKIRTGCIGDALRDSPTTFNCKTSY
ncbi:hypothetical protein T4B_5547 [Trichinella pseudospiralis]|uniref:Uncharacterized protein n=1 Tax=Trichinella pseudospiralis TaxID=6337 RepID=A0A0V1INR6_TRIPS|nr:hypothetical protein T4B_5547 [Trichinella pseudospiralis]KRZ29965.1 hypothetical protein T4C_6643 [Trichinella pseudospiralis]